MIHTKAQKEEIRAENRKTRAKDLKLAKKYDEKLFLATTAQAISYIIQAKGMTEDGSYITRAELLSMRENILEDIK